MLGTEYSRDEWTRGGVVGGDGGGQRATVILGRKENHLLVTGG